MRNAKYTLVLFTALAAPLAAQSLPEAAAEQADLDWLQLIDRADYNDAFEQAAAAMRSGTETEFARAIGQTRAPLGPLQSRKLHGEKETSKLPGAPDGHYVITQYDSAFAHKHTATETIIAVEEPDKTWRVTGYFIK